MSVPEILAELERLNDAEVAEIARHIRFRERVSDPAWKKEMDQRLDQLASGTHVISEEVVRASLTKRDESIDAC